MCGIVGYWSPAVAAQLATIHRMAESIAHRGPDANGLWLDKKAGLALGHRRLAILDLSPAGNQPMLSASGRFVISFNGEIYNHLELRQMLQLQNQAPNWRSHSDTETLLAGIQAWGLELTLRRSVGMFALALWDRETRSLTLARDRMGEKPLYYGWQRGVLLFASELKALRAHPAFDGQINRGALALYFRHNAIPGPYSIFQGIGKLPPGSFLTVTSQQAAESDIGEPNSYWSFSETAVQGQRDHFKGSEAEAADELERLLRQSVAGQMQADVPLGAFLSGGIDSSMVAALMQTQANYPVRTFSIGFPEDEYNEAEHAAVVARHLGTDHTELYVTPEQAIAVIPRLPELYDEPFADSSQIPTFLVAQLARQHVPVSLSGDGGDELFGGYNRYFLTQSIWRRVGWMPNTIRRGTARLLTAFSPGAWNRAFGIVGAAVPKRYRYANPGDKIHKLADILTNSSPESIYRTLVSHWVSPSSLVIGGDEPPTLLTRSDPWLHATDICHRMMSLDSVTYLPDDILVKVDRAAMGMSLETRAPLLDHRLVEFAWRLPLTMKVRHGQGKWLLRQVLNRYVPQDLIERPKMGFGVPIDAWLRGPLRDWAEDLLDERVMREAGFIDSKLVQHVWREHLHGNRNRQYLLWDVLMWESWRRAQAVKAL
jgi:asparagine synthase (glutamine-hydrolysing)